MDRLSTTRLRQFFATIQVPCPYLPERTEQKLVLELRGQDASQLHTELSRTIWRTGQPVRLAKPVCRCG